MFGSYLKAWISPGMETSAELEVIGRSRNLSLEAKKRRS